MNILKTLTRKLGFYRLSFPPGHYSSPIPDFQDVLNRSDEIFNSESEIQCIDLNEKKQLSLIHDLQVYFKIFPYEPQEKTGYRYYYNNRMFQQTDGLILFSIILHFKPQRIIEIGSGFSSAIILDINEHFISKKMQISFIEPFTDRLFSLLQKTDFDNVEIINKRIQQVPLNKYDDLTDGDILFLDTSHILKTGSDTSFWLFNILPRLKKGVIIHIHDIFYPFEYPKEWIIQQKCYNELYFIRAFLMNNDSYEILLFNSWLSQKHNNWFEKHAPFCSGTEGGSLWIRKIK